MVITLLLLGLLAAVMWKAIPAANAVAAPTEIIVYDEAPIPIRKISEATIFPTAMSTNYLPVPTDIAPARGTVILETSPINTEPTELGRSTDVQNPGATLVPESNWEPTQTESIPADKIATATARAVMGETATPTSAPASPTATISAAPQYAISESLIINGDFEQGPSYGWQEYSQLGYELIMEAASLTDLYPQDGNWAAWLGGANDEASSLSQKITIGCEGPMLSYYIWLASDDFCGYDIAQVKIDNQVITSFELCISNNFGGWKLFTYDLTSYIDQEILLEFSVVTDNSMSSSMFVDSVSLEPAQVPLCSPVSENPVAIYLPLITK